MFITSRYGARSSKHHRYADAVDVSMLATVGVAKGPHSAATVYHAISVLPDVSSDAATLSQHGVQTSEPMAVALSDGTDVTVVRVAAPTQSPHYVEMREPVTALFK